MTETTKETGTRLAKVLAQCGVASRRQAEVLIQSGRVMVNGKAATEVTTFVDLEKDSITVDCKPVDLPDRLRIWLYYKPVGVITTHRDPEGRPTVFEAAKAAGCPNGPAFPPGLSEPCFVLACGCACNECSPG